MTVLKMLVTVKQPLLTLTHLRRNVQYLNSPYVTVLHRKMTESQPYVHGGPHLWLPYLEIHTRMSEIVCACSRY